MIMDGMKSMAAEIKAALRAPPLLPTSSAASSVSAVAEVSPSRSSTPAHARVTRIEANELCKSEKNFIDFILAKVEKNESKSEITRLLKARRLYLTALNLVGNVAQAAARAFVIADELEVQDEEFLDGRFAQYAQQLEMRERLRNLGGRETKVKMEAIPQLKKPQSGPNSAATCAVCGDATHWWRSCPDTERKAAFITARERRLSRPNETGPSASTSAARTGVGAQ